MRIVGIGVLICALSLTVLGCMPGSGAGTTNGAEVRVGEQCTVQFRRDALGAAHPNPVPPLTNSINGAETSVSGTLVSADDSWVVLDRGDSGELWIPTSNVLLLQLLKRESS